MAVTCARCEAPVALILPGTPEPEVEAAVRGQTCHCGAQILGELEPTAPDAQLGGGGKVTLWQDTSSQRGKVALHRQGMVLREQKGAMGGRLKKSFRTRSGKVMQNAAPPGYDDHGRPIHRADAFITVWDWDGNEMKVTPRAGAALITTEEIPPQLLGNLG